MPPSWTALFGGTNIAPAIPGFLQLNISASTQLGWPIEANATSPIAAPIIEVNASAPALTVQLADARQVSDGSALLFNNVGANTFTVLDAQGNTLAAIASGQVWQLYLADNSTLQGTWRVFQFGAGVSNANASALAGLGLKAISTTLNEHIVINQQVASYNIQSGDRAACVEWVGGSGGVFTGPSPAGVGADWFCYIKNAGTGTLTFNPPSGTVDGGASKSFNPNDSCILICDGTNFITLGFGQAVASSFNFVQIGVTGGNLVLSGAQLNRVSYKFTGVLTSNQTITVPASIQQYWVDNETTGAFTLTVTAGAGATVAVSQGQRAILYCDGTNIVNAVSGSAAPTFPDGTAAAPSITFTSDLTLGLYKAGVDVLGFATAGVARGSISATGAWTINAPGSGTALTVNAVGGGPMANFLGAAGQVGWISVVDGQTGTRQWGLMAGASAIGTFDISDRTRGATPLSINSTGNVSINIPVSGTSLTVNTSVALQGAITVSDGTVQSQWQSTGAAAVWGTTGNFVAGIFTSNSTRLQISGAGNVTINNPSSGVTLTAIGIDRIVVLNTPGAATNSLLRYQENGVSKFSVGWNTGIGYIVYDDVNSAYRQTISPSGNWTIGVPTSGAGPLINVLDGTGVKIATTGTSDFLWFSNATDGNGFIVYNGSTMNFQTANTQRVSINGTGNVTINAPAAAPSLTLAETNSVITTLVMGASGGFATAIKLLGASAAQGRNFLIGNQNNVANALEFTPSTANGGSTFTTPAMTIGGAGNVAINAPASGNNALSVTGVANSYAVLITAPNTASQSAGLAIVAGTNTNDSPFFINNAANNTTYFQVLGNGESAIVQQPGFALQNSTTFDIGYVDIPQNLQNVSYPTVATDRGKSIDHTSGSAHTYTINDASVNYPVGTAISFDNNGAGIVTISVQTTPANLIWGPSGATGNRFLAQNGVATARKIAAGAPGTWRITGVGLS